VTPSLRTPKSDKKGRDFEKFRDLSHRVRLDLRPNQALKRPQMLILLIYNTLI
jgi:hypothetical protein